MAVPAVRANSSRSSSSRVRACTETGAPSRRPLAGLSGVVGPSTCGNEMRTRRSTRAARHASSRLANQAVLVTGRKRSGRGANSTPAKCTTVSTPATAGASDAGSARSARTTCVRGRRLRSSRTSLRCTMRRRSCSLPASRSARRPPRLPAAPVMRMVRAVMLPSYATVPPACFGRVAAISPRLHRVIVEAYNATSECRSGRKDQLGDPDRRLLLRGRDSRPPSLPICVISARWCKRRRGHDGASGQGNCGATTYRSPRRRTATDRMFDRAAAPTASTADLPTARRDRRRR